MRVVRSMFFIAAWLATAGVSQAAPLAGARGGFAESAQPLLQRYCFDCHGPKKQKAQLRYDQLAGYRVEDRNLWAKMHEKIADGEMPPPDEHPQPTDAERRQLLSWIEQEAAAARKAQGAGSTRRLNRRELSAALRDVTGLSVDYASSMPGDGKVGGFDTGAEALQDAADSVSQVMIITRRAVDGIRFLGPAPGTVQVVDLLEAAEPKKALEVLSGKESKQGKPKPGAPKGLLIDPSWVGDRNAINLNLPAPVGNRGVLRLKLVVSAKKPFPNVPNPRLWVDVGGKDIDYHEVTGTFEKPDELTYEVQIDDLAVGTKGLGLSLSNKVEVPYGVEGFANDEPEARPDRPQDVVPGGVGLFRPRYDRKQPQDKHPVPWIVLHRIEVDLNHVAAWPPENWKADLGGPVADNTDSAKRLLNVWVERAWRQPVAATEQERFVTLYTKLRGQGMSFDDALRAAFQSALMSGGFRYLPSPADPAAGQHAIASRLAFMLWGAPPDDELRKLAVEGKMRDPAVLDAQVDRLLADARSGGFFRPFVTQWLEMDQPITVAMDHIRKQDFRWGRHLKASMREETIQYVATLLAENRPAAELVASDWTLMNDILARHYGYPGVEGGQMRKVTLRPDDPRGGGIFGHAGIQSMLCWMGENWVIYRGAWALRHVLDDPPPPAPLEVPELVPSDGKNKGKPFRELLVQHQADANCTICHKKMDPLGFAFQNFDLSGRWRDVEYESYARNELDGKIEWRGVGASRPVDAVGKLPRGEAFKDYAEFKRLLAANYQDDVVRGLLKNLVVYAAGRSPDVDDLSAVRAIMKQLGPTKYPLRDVFKAAIRSRVFLEN